MLLRLATACLLCCFASANPALAQFSKTMHSSFPTDDIQTIKISLVDNVTVEHWAGNTILVQTDVRLYNASKGLFDFLTGEDGRYQVDAGTDGTTLNLVNVKPSRAELNSKQGTTREEINVKVLLPEDFIGEGAGPYRRADAVEPRDSVTLPLDALVLPADTLYAPVDSTGRTGS